MNDPIETTKTTVTALDALARQLLRAESDVADKTRDHKAAREVFDEAHVAYQRVWGAWNGAVSHRQGLKAQWDKLAPTINLPPWDQFYARVVSETTTKVVKDDATKVAPPATPTPTPTPPAPEPTKGKTTVDLVTLLGFDPSSRGGTLLRVVLESVRGPIGTQELVRTIIAKAPPGSLWSMAEVMKALDHLTQMGVLRVVTLLGYAQFAPGRLFPKEALDAPTTTVVVPPATPAPVPTPVVVPSTAPSMVRGDGKSVPTTLWQDILRCYHGSTDRGFTLNDLFYALRPTHPVSATTIRVLVNRMLDQSVLTERSVNGQTYYARGASFPKDPPPPPTTDHWFCDCRSGMDNKPIPVPALFDHCSFCGARRPDTVTPVVTPPVVTAPTPTPSAPVTTPTPVATPGPKTGRRLGPVNIHGDIYPPGAHASTRDLLDWLRKDHAHAPVTLETILAHVAATQGFPAGSGIGNRAARTRASHTLASLVDQGCLRRRSKGFYEVCDYRQYKVPTV